MKHMCPFCEVGEMSTVVYTRSVKAGRRTVRVPGLSKMVCGHCEEESIPLEMYGRNAKLVEQALESTSMALSKASLTTLRENFELSQRDASRLFGAGPTSFAKWESSQSGMSKPAALLLQCALHVPGVMEYLARLAEVELQPHAGLRKSRVATEYNTAFLKEAAVADAAPQGLRLVIGNSKRTPTPRPVWNKGYSSMPGLSLVA